MSAVVIHQPGMPSVMDAINPPPSFSARKTAASNVPVPGRIDLPVNPVTAKFTNSVSMGAHHQGSINSLLTPPSNISGDSLSPISSAASSSQQGPASQGIPPFTPNGSWNGPSGSGLTPVMSSNSGNTPHTWGSSMNFPAPKNVFSPLGSLVGSSSSPVKSDALPPPPYNMHDLHPSHSYSTSNATMASTMAQHTNGLPATHSGQQMGYLPMSQSQLTTAAVSSVPSQPNPLSPGDGYMRAPLTPATSYYGSHSSSAPMQNQFSYSNVSPPALSPPPRISPMSSGSNFPPPPPLPGTPTHASQQPYGGRPYQPYGPPMGMMAGPGLGGMHNAPFNSGIAAANQMHRFYDQNGHHHHGGMLGAPPLAHNDRPFKCDQCPQSFNRNHDLKRHKRIHLAVKPFPCGFCDKSFSRKDALKRHILVKGCGKAMAAKDGKSTDVDDNASSKSDSEGDESVAHSG